MFADPTSLLRLALTLSLTVYIEPDKKAKGDSLFTVVPLFEEKERSVPPQLGAWGERKEDYPWVKSLQLISTIVTTKDADAVADIKCELYYHADNRMLIISFRGTETMENAITDLHYFQQALDPQVFPLPPRAATNASEPAVHSGFQEAYLAIREKIIAVLRDALNSLRVNDLLCVGHSLGGALASLAALDLSLNKAQFLPSTQPSLFSFGCPHIGDQAFADLFVTQVPRSIRIASHADPVTHILEQTKVSAQWLQHNHEPFVHAATVEIVLKLDALQALAGIVSPPDGSPWWKALVTQVTDQHSCLGYLHAVEAHIQAQEVVGQPVLQNGEDPEALLTAVTAAAESWLLGSERDAPENDTPAEPTASTTTTATTTTSVTSENATTTATTTATVTTTASSTTTSTTTATTSSTSSIISSLSSIATTIRAGIDDTQPSDSSSK